MKVRNTTVMFLISMMSTSSGSEPKDKSGSIPKSTQNERNNILIPPIGPPNIQSSSGATNQQSGPKSLPSSELLSGARKQSPDYSYPYRTAAKTDDRNYCDLGQTNVECSNLSGDCVECNFDAVKNTCIYGKNVTVSCNPKESVICQGERRFQKEIICHYCYQTPLWQQSCNGNSMCNSVGAPRNHYKGNCTVVAEVLCLGNRRFQRMIPCNWKNGYRWSTTLFLSITLGGFGADRFYLGRWQEGIGKLFSFGGLGLWTFVDIILISVRYLGPADGSLYVD